ncbi:glycerol dehydratase [Clostridium botulinum]|uniref:Glycerol dehydratase reactivation factor, small subunit n=1 Tax=Clostridium botulinum (strain Eklund 17B / Type B) TaxID=935198 RepID=B2TLK4_CLOBB|nr:MULTISPECIES: glycerol dehydratase reactivase beta/small subunit family protein [Clostridium]ACD24459.1 glycerol dehydratase reactivation factor, small subunit [Clostridium botulinum B str. Eklund 17B (NRP)]KFX55335.1 glycerol dehydratase [Clostridium botulinum]KFX56013.1 glycerol dehydratase [Clostridium botulinum]MBN1045689.1 glycerol dehydratase [Clostridium botulinum]MBN1052431.1 glycerol dehydratase [Clostridium botulinum]
MVMRHFKYDMPTICLYHSSNLEDLTKFNEILWGLEEEGIPCNISSKEDSLSSEELSHMASQDSKLAVGIGIDKSGKITLTLNKLKKYEPLFTVSLNDEDKVLRALGANAGRLVKGIAFK